MILQKHWGKKCTSGKVKENLEKGHKEMRILSCYLTPIPPLLKKITDFSYRSSFAKCGPLDRSIGSSRISLDIQNLRPHLYSIRIFMFNKMPRWFI